MKKMGMRRMVGVRKRGAPMPKAMAAPKAMSPAAMEGQMAPMPGMKKGGAVKKMAKGGKVAKPGIGMMIILGKKGK